MTEPEQLLIKQIDSVIADKSVPAHRKAAYKELRAIAKRIRKSKPATQPAPRGRKLSVDPAEVKRLRAGGKTIQQIADTLGVGLATVSRALKLSD